MFYLGCLRGAQGSRHEALENEVGLHSQPKRLDRETWRQVWNKGPLLTKVSVEDELLCYKRYAKRAAVDEQKRQLFSSFAKERSKRQRQLDGRVREAEDHNARLFERRFEVEEVWEGRAHLDWANFDDDTATRLLMWEIYGGLPGTPSPPTTPSLEALHGLLLAECRRAGTLPLVAQRNLELWTEAAYYAVQQNRVVEVEGLQEDFIGYARDLLNARKADESQKLLNPYRQPVTGFYVNKPTSKALEHLPCRKLEDFRAFQTDLMKNLRLLAWHKGAMQQQLQTDVRFFAAEQDAEMEVRREMRRELEKRQMASKVELAAVDEAIEQTKKAVHHISKDDEAWQKALRRKGKAMQAEYAHLLSSIPVQEVPASPYVVERPVEDSLDFKETQLKVSDTFQATLAELLSTPLYKKCLITSDKAKVDELRAGLYELAWLLTKERAHDVYSQQRVEVNGLVQVARRKVEVATRAIADATENADLFSTEINTPSYKDFLYAPDEYSTDLHTVTVAKLTEPFTTGGFEDQAPGVRV